MSLQELTPATEVHLELSRTSTVEIFCGNIKLLDFLRKYLYRLLAVNSFRKKSSIPAKFYEVAQCSYSFIQQNEIATTFLLFNISFNGRVITGRYLGLHQKMTLQSFNVNLVSSSSFRYIFKIALGKTLL